ncbi:GntR family transcriptional regulator [Pelagibacterium sp.]|uniref:GntR family transcriptional regulator n=1 Tax=Pelagibacterium sp. TaxID=1967288 RepID=UPI003A8CD0A9
MTKPDVPQLSRGQSAYQSILKAIRDGVFRPGDRLREEDVAQRIGVSRTPVREALGRLLEKGLIETGTGRGLAVSTLSMPQVFELYAMRQELEGLVARFAAHHATDVEIENFERLNDQFRTAQSPELAKELNRILHARLYDACRNRYLRQAVDELQETIILLPDTTFVSTGRIEAASDEHARIIGAIRARDADAAQNAGIDHIARALTVRLQIAKDNRPAATDDA